MDTNDTAIGGVPAPVGQVLDQHRECIKLVEELEDCLDRKPEPRDEWLQSVRSCLKRLRGSLEEHFRAESEGWLYREMPLRRPRFAPALERLHAEHPDLLADIERVAQRAASLTRPERHQVRELAGRLQLFTARLRRHEAEENEILVAAVFEETGTGG